MAQDTSGVGHRNVSLSDCIIIIVSRMQLCNLPSHRCYGKPFNGKNENISLWGSGAAANTFAKSVEKKLDQEIYLLARRMIF